LSLPIPGINGTPLYGPQIPQYGPFVPKKKKSKKKGGSSGGFNLPISLGQPATQAGSLAEAIERQAANQKAQAAQTSGLASVDPFQMLQQQLFGAANNINVAATPLEQLRQMAQQQVSAQYDPQISALENEASIHSKRGQQSASTARQMYGALAKDTLSQLPGLTSQFKAEDDATNQRYDQAQQQMQGEYDQQAAQQDAVLKKLGIQAASQDASQQSKDDQAYFQNQSESDQQNAQTALQQQQEAQSDYTQNSGNNAKMAGENTAQDIMSQLTDYLDQNSNQVQSLTAGKQSAIAALLQQMQSQDASRVQTESQQQFDNMMKLYNYQLDATKADQSASGTASGFGSGTGSSAITSGLPGAQNYLASQYPDQPILAKNLMEQLNDVLSNKDVTNGKFQLTPGDPSMGKSPTYSDVGQQYMEDLLRAQFAKQNGRYSTGDINSTMAALEAYLGKLH
jgi:hypothetical protein